MKANIWQWLFEDFEGKLLKCEEVSGTMLHMKCKKMELRVSDDGNELCAAA